MAQAPPVDTTVHSPQQAFGNVQRGHWEVQPEEIQLGSKIGEGANAVILKARFRGQTCVAKMLKSGVSANTQAYKDLIMELEILTSVTAHPNVVQFMGACIRTPEKPVVHTNAVALMPPRHTRVCKLDENSGIASTF